MRKRLLALALGLVLAASALAGCGSKGTGESAPAANEESPAVESGAAESAAAEGTQAGGAVSDQELVELRLIFTEICLPVVRSSLKMNSMTLFLRI